MICLLVALSVIPSALAYSSVRGGVGKDTDNKHVFTVSRKLLGPKNKAPGKLITDRFPPRTKPNGSGLFGEGSEQLSTAAARPLVVPYNETFLLHSYQGASQILYLDFNGHKGGYKPFDTDGDTTTFSNEERKIIQDVWRSVTEDFLPWKIDVTTEDPVGDSDCRSDCWYGMRAVIDGSRKYGGGWAYGNTWGNQPPDWLDYIAYCEQYDEGDETWLWIADCIVHEVGHTFGLNHDGPGNNDDYYRGHGSGETEWCPSMGWGGYSLNVWSKGDYFGATNTAQNDLEIITAYGPTGVPYREDDHGDAFGSATDISVDITSTDDLWADGIVGRNDNTHHDVDFFSFVLAEKSTVQISINKDVILGASNLDAFFTLYDGTETKIFDSLEYDPDNTKIGVEFSRVLESGTYYFSIEGKGWGDPMNNPPMGYSDYGIMGAYTIHGAAVPYNTQSTTTSTSTTISTPTVTSSTSTTTSTTSVTTATTSTTSCPSPPGSLAKGSGCSEDCECDSNKCTGKNGSQTCK